MDFNLFSLDIFQSRGTVQFSDSTVAVGLCGGILVCMCFEANGRRRKISVNAVVAL